MQYLHFAETCNRIRKRVCCIIIRKRNTTNVFLTGFEFPRFCEAEDMESVMTLLSATFKGCVFFFTRGIDADSFYIIRSKI